MSDNKELRAAAFELYKPPFRHIHGYIYDAEDRVVADDAASSVSLRIRGWGRIQYMENPEALQDTAAELIAEALTEYWNRRAAQPVVLSDDLRDKVRDAVAAALGEAMDCTRVWSAWSYGTMGPNDFSVVANDDDRLEEIVDAAINAILAAKEQA